MKRKYNVVIIDDLQDGIYQIQSSLLGFNNITIAGTASCVETGELLVMTVCPDLLFLDIEMPGKNGLDLLRTLRNGGATWPIQIIMYSSNPNYIIDSFREFAFDFLQIPYHKNEFTLVMERFFLFKANEVNSNKMIRQQTNLMDSKFMIATHSGSQVIPINQIGYFEYIKERKLWTVLLSNKKQLPLKYNTNSDIILAYSTSFIRINQYQIINLIFLSSIENNQCTLLSPFDTETGLKVSRNALKMLQQEFNQM